MKTKMKWIGIFFLAAPVALLAGEKKKDAPAGAADSLDVTITGEARDEIPLTKPEPSVDISFDKIAGLSREGQTDRVLTGPVEHMTGEDQMSLLHMDSRQTYLGLPIRIPSAPFIRMEISPGLSSYIWELQILDQNDKALKALEGTTLPKYVVEWDGFHDGTFRLLAGSAYTPVLVLTDEKKRVQRYFGEPVRYTAMQYIQDGLLHIEFDNTRLFERGRSDFSPDTLPYLAASLNVLRQHVGKPIRVILFAAPGNSPLPARRLETLKSFYKEALAIEDDMISFDVQPMRDRGDVTELLAAAQ